MAFKLTQTPTFSAKLTINTANDKGGWDRSTMMVSFHRATTDELKELSGLTGAELLTRKLSGWRELVDDSGNDVPFNPENLDAFLRLPEAVTAAATAFWHGVHKANEKN